MNRPVGIDLGTTYSAIAVVNEAGRAEVLRNKDGDTITPSVVLFDPEEPQPLVGAEAKSLAGAMPTRVVESVKRAMGKETQWEIDGQIYSPADISSLILKKLKDDAEQRLGYPVRDAVVTVPAYFAHRERQATVQAAEKAGLHVLQIINEPTAAAIAYGVDHASSDRTILVYDLGGGTFDVTLLKVMSDGIQVLTTLGDVELGGKDWDAVLVDHAADAFVAAHRQDPRDDDDAYQLLMAEAEAAKKSLTARSQVAIGVRLGSHTLQVPVTRAQFDAWAQANLERTRSTVHVVLDRAKMVPDDVHQVLLVGGSTRMPMVRDMLGAMFPGKVDMTIHPDECVALGAAIVAAKAQVDKLPAGERAKLAPSARNLLGMKVVDITAHSLGTVVVEDDRLATSIIIPKDRPIPAQGTKVYQTSRDNQESLLVPVLQGESANPQVNQLLACYEFTGIPPRPAGQTRLEVAFRYDVSGLVEVEAKDTLSGQNLQRSEHALQDLNELRGLQSEPLAVVLLIDTSGSMAGRPLDDAKDGAAEFINRLSSGDVELAGGVEVGLVTFGGTARVVVDLGCRRDQALSLIKSMGAHGGTPMSDAIRLAHDMLEGRQGRRVMVLLTDGEPNDRGRAQNVAANAAEDGIVIIALSCPGADEDFLARICTPGLDVRSVTDTSQLSTAFGNLASEISRAQDLRSL